MAPKSVALRSNMVRAKVQKPVKKVSTPSTQKKKHALLEAEKTTPSGTRCSLAGVDLAVAEAFMMSAAASACAGVRIGHGGPFGASIVRDGVIVCCAHNMVLHNSDPTCHAEMNAIKQACQSLGTHDLSDCELFTTCEPCPMCWGAVQWSRLGKVHIGVDRHIAAKYGFDDKVFYDEVDAKAGHYDLKRYGYVQDTRAEEIHKESELKVKNMVEIYDGILHSEVAKLFCDPLHNRTLRRRFTASHIKGQLASDELIGECKPTCPPSPESESPTMCRASPPRDPTAMSQHQNFMRLAIKAAERGVKAGLSKEREPFGVVIVKDGIVLAETHNMVLETRDATATAEVSAIRAAADKLGTHNLEGCDLYSTSHPDLMSLGAILWARISHVYCGVTQQLAAKCGFEEGILHFKDLIEVHNGKRVTEVVEAVAQDQCEAVFREWSDRNGVIY